VAEAKVVDYYSVLHLPTTADLMGVENAYARLSDELVRLAEHDEGCADSLHRLNEAYAVLSRPELRREYDRIFLAEQIALNQKRARAEERRRALLQWAVIAALAFVAVGQAVFLAYLGREEIGALIDAIT
jgi:curved DNA-binding protein CbpA